MKNVVLFTAAVVLLSACGRSISTARPATTSGAAVAAPDAGRRAESGKGEKTRGPRALNGVPPGHYPPAGQCRLWYTGRPPGQQPRATTCASLAGRVPAGAFILHNGKAWDGDYDWVSQARRQPGSVPQLIVDLVKRRPVS